MNKCIDCEKKIDKRAKRCAKCYHKYAIGKYEDRKSPNYIDGRTLRKHYCKICKINEISLRNFLTGKCRCRMCNGKYMSKKYKIKHPLKGQKAWNNGIPMKEEQKKKISLSMGGTGIPYENNKYPKEYFKIRPKILKRDNYICQKCLEYGNEVHHIDYDKQNNDESNLICLCHGCNVEVNRNRNYWKEYFKIIK